MTTCQTRGLRLCVIVNSLNVGGAETQLLRLCRVLASRIDVEVVYYGGEHVLLDPYRHSGARITFIEKDAMSRAAFIRRLTGHIRRGRFDCVHCWLGTANQYGVTAALLAGAGCILTGHRSQGSPGRLRALFDRLAAPFTAGRMVNSYAIRRSYCRRAGYPARQVYVVHNGFDPAEFENLPPASQTRAWLGLPLDRPVVVTVGRLVPVKDHETFIRSAGEPPMQRLGAHFVLVGDGPLLDKLSATAAACGAGERVHFLGRRTDVPAILAACDAAVCSSVEEGLPNAVVEGMLAGAPVISADNGGGPEAIGNPEQIVPVGDAAALAEKLARVLTDRELAERWSRIGRQRATAEFSIEASARRYLALLDDRLAAARRKRER